MKTILSNGMSAKDIFNTRTASNTIKDFIGVSIPVHGYAIVSDTDKKTGEPIELGYIKSENGNILGFKSGVSVEALKNFDDFISDAEIDITKGEIMIEFTSQTANSGREFYTFKIVE